MALVVADRVQETAAAVTTVSFTLSGAVTGFRTFSAGIGANNTTYYSSTDASGNWEVGLGTLDSLATTLTRTTILSSSNSGSAVTFSGTVNVFVTYPASKAVTSTVGIAQGGTGQTTQAAALTALSGTQSSGKYLRSDGTNTALASIVAGDVPTLNQSTTGSAATLTTARGIYGNNFDGSAPLTQIIASTYGGTGNGFTKFSGATTSEKTYTLPNSTCSILTNFTAVTVGQGGTGASSASAGFNALSPITTTGDLIIGDGTNSATRLAIGSNSYVLTSNGTTASWVAPSSGVLAKNTQVFTSGTAATYTAPANTQWVKVTVVGPGGNGGNGTSARGTGGSAGGVAIKWLAMTAGQTLTYTVGTATTVNSTVSSGTLTITTITANSGTAGTATAYANSSSAGPTGGTATGGDINITGGSGGNSYGSSTTVATNFSGKGGDCPGFGSGGGSYGSSATAGQNGVGYGAGGGGSHGVSSTPAGAGGIIIFEAF